MVEVDDGTATVQWKALQDSRKRPQVFLARDTFRYNVRMPAMVRAPAAPGMMTHTP